MDNQAALSRCRIVPQADHRVVFEIEGRRPVTWHHGPTYPRPFFFPVLDPAGNDLTRLGHPGAPSHEHHLSVWFGHQNVGSCNFWENGHGTMIRQRQWLCYQDGRDEAIMAVALDWQDRDSAQPLVEQELIVVVSPSNGGGTGSGDTDDGGTLVELQSTFRPLAKELEFGRTNFGFLGVRVAKGVSMYFGDGVLADSEGRRGESAIFGRPARWVDYSGAVGTAAHTTRGGITYFDHPQNPGFPNRWHVRADGWMLASPCMHGPLVTTRDRPLVLRYLLYAHRGPVQTDRFNEVARRFAARENLRLARAPSPNIQYQVRRHGNP